MIRKLKRLILNLLWDIKYSNVKFNFVGRNCVYKSHKSRFINSQNITLGNNVHVGPGCELHGLGGIVIGNGIIFAPQVILYTRSHNFNSIDLKALPYDNRIIVSPILIEDNVWIGRNAIILQGVTIGEGSVIGAGAVVAKSVPKGSIVVGNPGKVIKVRNMEVYNRLKTKNKFVYSEFGHKKITIDKNSIKNG